MHPRARSTLVAQYYLQGRRRSNREERVPQRCCQQQPRLESLHELVGRPHHQRSGSRYAFRALRDVQPLRVPLASHSAHQDMHAAEV